MFFMGYSSNIQLLLAQNVREGRLAQRLSQQQLADMVDVSVLSISNIERGFSWPKPETLDKIADILKMAPYELFLTATDEIASKASLVSTIDSIIHEMRDFQQGLINLHPARTYRISHPIKHKK